MPRSHRVLAPLATLAGLLFLCAAAHGQAPATAFEPGGRIWAQAFGDYFYKFSGDDHGWGDTQYARMPEGADGVLLRRFRLGHDYAFAPNISSRLAIEATDASTFAAGSYGFAVRAAYLAWREPIPGLPVTVQAGIVPTPIYAYTERAWGYRSLEKDILDVRTFGRSTDGGVGVEGQFGEDRHTGFHFVVGNNTGTRPPANLPKALYGSVFHRPFGGIVTVEVMGSHLPGLGERRVQVARLFVDVDHPSVRLGGGVSLVSDRRPTELPDAAMRRLLVSAHGAVPLVRGPRPLLAFVRYDFYDPDIDFDASRAYLEPEPFYTEHTVIAGLDYRPAPQVRVMPNLWVNAYRQRGPSIEARQADVVPRITLFFAY
jgi:hypothetical protein